jgi:Concanavalin A-like lectin/glucanases superfamily
MKKPLISTFFVFSVIVFYLSIGCTRTNTRTITVTDTVTTVKTDTVIKTIVDTINICDSMNVHMMDSLWAYYPVNGNLNDSSGNNHVLVLNGNATLSEDAWGNSNSALDFNSSGTSDYGIIADGANFQSQVFSVSMSLMYRNLSGYPFGKQSYSNADGATFNMGIDPVALASGFRFSISSNQSGLCTNAPASGLVLYAPAGLQPQVNTWYSVVITFGAGVQSLYINGSLAATANISAQTLTFCSVAPFILANWWQGDNDPNFNGKMDDIRIYSKTLNPTEVYYLYELGKK